MATITVWNKGKRTWDIRDAQGEKIRLSPNECAEMNEVEGLRLIASYPRDLTTSKASSINSADLKRREQSIHDKELHLKEREKALDEREKAIKDREAALDEGKPKRGRPAKTKDEAGEASE